MMTPAAKKKGKYDAKFKLQVIQFAERFSNRAAGSKFGLNESTIRGWRKVKRAPSAAVVAPCCSLPPHAPAAAVAPRRTPELQAPELSHEPARADALLGPSDGPLLYRKCEPREPVATAAAPTAEPASPPPPARTTFLPSMPASSQSPRRVLVRRSQLTDGGFPELTVPFTVIAEKALRALYRQKHHVAAHEPYPTSPHMGVGPNREVFASFLGLTPNRLVDNVT